MAHHQTYSDNGTNFVGADRELEKSLQEWNQSQIEDFLSQKGIQWHFNPPAAPHFGGIWERLVHSCKKALKVVLHGQVVTDEVLETAFAETEALVNSRPLTEVRSSSSDLEAITPNHFLISLRILCYPVVFFQTRKFPVRNGGGRHKSLLIKFGQGGYENTCQP